MRMSWSLGGMKSDRRGNIGTNLLHLEQALSAHALFCLLLQNLHPNESVLQSDEQTKLAHDASIAILRWIGPGPSLYLVINSHILRTTVERVFETKTKPKPVVVFLSTAWLETLKAVQCNKSLYTTII